MKQVSSTSFAKKIQSATLWGLVFFGTFGMALFAYAVGFPNTQPNPASGVVGMYVGSTPNVYQGVTGSYEAVNALCTAEFDNSHVCTATEMINTYNHNPSALNGVVSRFWVNGGMLVNGNAMANDCNGWTTKDATRFGQVWDASQAQGFTSSCDMQRAYACCK